MYLTLDIYTPKQNIYVRNLKIKNTIMRYWPTKIIHDADTDEDVEVFDKLVIYMGGVLPYNDVYKELYKLIGTSYKELFTQNWQHVDSAWFYLKPFKVDDTTLELTNHQVAEYIDNNSELGKEYEVRIQYTQEFSSTKITASNHITNEQIIKLVEGGYNSMYNPEEIVPEDEELRKVGEKPVYQTSMMTFDTKPCPVTFASLMDTDDELFESSSKVISRSVVEVNPRTDGQEKFYNYNYLEYRDYTIRATISYKFKRNVNAVGIEDSGYITEIKNIALSNPQDPYSFARQLQNLLREFNPVLPGELLATYSNTNGFINDDEDEYKTQYIRKDAAGELKPADFSTVILKAIDVGYEQEDCKGWKCVIAVVFMFIVIILAVYFAPAAGVLMGMAEGSALAFFGGLSLTLTVGTLVMAGVGKYLSKNGEYGMAIAFGRSLTVLGKFSEIVGYLTMFIGWFNFFRSAAGSVATNAATASTATATSANVAETTVASSVVNEVSVEVVQPTISDFIDEAFSSIVSMFEDAFNVITKSPLRALNTIVDWLSKGFKVYTTWMQHTQKPAGANTPTESEGIPAHVEDIEVKRMQFDSYQFCEMNELMDSMPSNMTTRGLMRETLSKYYDAL